MIGGQAAAPPWTHRPRLELVDPATIERVLCEAFGVLDEPGVGVADPEAAAPLAVAGRFLDLPETRRRFRAEQHLPSRVIDRGSLGAWRLAGASDIVQPAQAEVAAILAEPPSPALKEETGRPGRAAGVGAAFGGVAPT